MSISGAAIEVSNPQDIPERKGRRYANRLLRR
jgi:hypothetical protein